MIIAYNIRIYKQGFKNVLHIGQQVLMGVSFITFHCIHDRSWIWFRKVPRAYGGKRLVIYNFELQLTTTGLWGTREKGWNIVTQTVTQSQEHAQVELKPNVAFLEEKTGTKLKKHSNVAKCNIIRLLKNVLLPA